MKLMARKVEDDRTKSSKKNVLRNIVSHPELKSLKWNLSLYKDIHIIYKYIYYIHTKLNSILRQKQSHTHLLCIQLPPPSDLRTLSRNDQGSLKLMN